MSITDTFDISNKRFLHGLIPLTTFLSVWVQYLQYF